MNYISVTGLASYTYGNAHMKTARNVKKVAGSAFLIIAMLIHCSKHYFSKYFLRSEWIKCIIHVVSEFFVHEDSKNVLEISYFRVIAVESHFDLSTLDMF